MIVQVVPPRVGAKDTDLLERLVDGNQHIRHRVVIVRGDVWDDTLLRAQVAQDVVNDFADGHEIPRRWQW